MEIFFRSTEYKKMKTQYEQQCFKLFCKYWKYDGEKITEKSASEMSKYFKNKKIIVEYVEHQTTKKGTTILTTKEFSKSFYQIWSEDPDMREFQKIVFNCNLAKVKPFQFNLFDGFIQILWTHEIIGKFQRWAFWIYLKLLSPDRSTTSYTTS